MRSLNGDHNLSCSLISKAKETCPRRVPEHLTLWWTLVDAMQLGYVNEGQCGRTNVDQLVENRRRRSGLHRAGYDWHIANLMRPRRLRRKTTPNEFVV